MIYIMLLVPTVRRRQMDKEDSRRKTLTLSHGWEFWVRTETTPDLSILVKTFNSISVCNVN
jgi:hypothetical protein